MKTTFSPRLSFLFLFTLFTTPLFAQQPKTAIEMNNYLTNRLDSIYSKGVAWGTELGNAYKTGSYVNLKIQRMELEILLNKDIKDISAINDVGGSEDFRKAMVSFFYFEKKLASSSFRPFETLSSSSTEDEKDKLQKNLEENAGNEGVELDKVRKTQKAYADKNGFTIESGDTGTAREPKTAIEMNNYLTDMLVSINSKGVAWGTELGNAYKTGSYDNLKNIRMEMERLIDNDIKDINALNDIGGSGDFYEAMVSFFHFEKDLANSSFKPFENLSSTSTEDEKDKLEKNLTKNAANEDAELDKVRKTQKAYAGKNGFTIEPADTGTGGK